MTHPDGRLQRLRPGIGHQGSVRAGWRVLVELGQRLGLDLPHSTLSDVVAEIAAAVPFYRGITLDEIGGRGVRWQEREHSLQAANERLPELRFSSPEQPPPLPEAPEGGLRLCARPSLWASWETERSPALDFLEVEQTLELHPADAERLVIGDGDEVEVVSNGSSLRARARLREAARNGCGYLIEGTAREGVNILADGDPVLVEVRPRDRAAVAGARAEA